MKLVSFLFLFTVWSCCHGQLTFTDRTSDLSFENFNPAFEYGCGVSAADYNNDGFIDLYVLSDASSPNRLYLNNGDGTLSVVEVGVSEMMKSRAALWFDFDGDTLLDLVVAGDCFANTGSCKDEDNIKLFRQNVNGQFEDATSESGLLTGRAFEGAFGGFSAGDINNDGYLDLLTVEWEGKINLFLNNRDGTFVDITNSAGLNVPGRYWQPSFFDFDEDGYTDLYLNVDSYENLFFRNNGDNTFTEIGSELNLNLDWDCMGLALGDYDNDEDMDIYISNIFSSTEHNAMLQNNGNPSDLQFTEVGRNIGVGEGGWGWGVTFLDGNNDGFLDLAATNGWHANQGIDRSKYWENQGDGSFVDVSSEVGFNGNMEATTLISLDLDRDGDLDLIQTLKEDQGGGIRYYDNQLSPSANSANYFVVKPRMLGANHHAIGSVVKIKTGEMTQTRPITAGISYYGQEPAEAFFGVGSYETIDEVKIIWPGGAVSHFADFPANQVLTITDQNVLHSPGNISVKEMPGPAIELKWGSMNVSDTDFVLEKSSSSSFETFSTINVSENNLKYVDEDVNPYQTYYYRVRATNGTDLSVSSPKISISTGSGILINAPTNLSAIAQSITSAILSWNDLSDNETGFVLERSLFGDFSPSISIELPQDQLQFVDTFLEPYTTYFYRIRAVGEGAVSEFSNTVSISTTILEVGEEQHVIIFPNPSAGEIHLARLNLDRKDLEFSLFDLTGKPIAIYVTQTQSGITIVPIPIPNSGWYILQVVSSKGSSFHRIRFK